MRASAVSYFSDSGEILESLRTLPDQATLAISADVAPVLLTPS